MLSPAAAAVASGLAVGMAAAGGRWAGRRVAAGHLLRRLGRHRPAPVRVPASPLVARALADAGAGTDPALVTWGWLVGGLGLATVGLAVAGLPAGALGVAVALAAPRFAARTALARRVRRTDAQLPELLDQVGRSLRGGASLHLALDDACRLVGPPLGHELDRVRDEVEAGAPLVDALDRWAARSPRRPVRLVVAALASSAESGGAGARAVDGVAASLRASAGVAGEIRALASQARYSALVIALAPLAFSLVAVGLDPRSAGFLVGTPVGQLCLAAGLGLDALGAWWMQRIVAAPA
ncbi:MAG: type II secretion system F family protein [Acidimicrobiia bacterium]